MRKDRQMLITLTCYTHALNYHTVPPKFVQLPYVSKK